MLLKLAQDSCSKLQALSLDFPVLFISECRNLLRDLEHSLRVLLCNSTKHVDRINTNIDALVGKTNECVVEEDVEPLLIELGLLLKHVRLAAVDELIVAQVLLQVLDDSNAELHIVGAVCIDQLAQLLALVGALFNQGAV